MRICKATKRRRNFGKYWWFPKWGIEIQLSWGHFLVLAYTPRKAFRLAISN